MIRTKKALITLAIAGVAALGTAAPALALSGHEGPARGASTQTKDTPEATPLDEVFPAPLPN
ncbi:MULTISPECIES: hypothetical protein [unclassified Streptomyces]|uniref:hypothetical protein n=1 Tax=unclassified Streptomyces TaxID=2593676 RepID=UPI003369C4CE